VGLAHGGTWLGRANGFDPLGLFGPRPKQGKISPTGVAVAAIDSGDGW
jgi:hypothetical protein